MMLRALLSLCLMACFGCAAESGSEVIQITAPANGSAQRSRRVIVTGTVSDPEIFEVNVNGELVPVVSGYFEVEIEGAEGPLEIIAQADGERDRVKIDIDRTNPLVVIESPERASFVSGSELRVVGRVEDATQVDLRLNGREIVVDEDGRFDAALATTPGAYRARLIATDSAGNDGSAFTTAIFGDFRNSDTELEDAFLGQLGVGVFDLVNDQITSVFTEERMSEMLVALGELRPNENTRIRFLSLSYEDIEVTTTPGDNELIIEAILINPRVNVEGRRRVGAWTPWIDGAVVADELSIRSRMLITPTRAGLSAELLDTEVTMVNQRADVPGAFGWLVEILVEDTVEELPTTLQMLAEEELPRLVNNFLVTLSPSFSLSFGGAMVRVEGRVAAIDISPRIGIHALGYSELSLGSGGRQILDSPGVLHLPQMLPLDATRDLRVGLAANLLNRGFHMAWSTGTLTYERDAVFNERPVTVSTVSIFAPSLPESLSQDSPVEMQLSLALPPVLVGGEDGTAELLAVDVEARFVTADTRRELFVLSAALAAQLDITVTDGEMEAVIEDYEFTVSQVSQANVGLPQGTALDETARDIVGPLLTEFTRIDGIQVPTVFGVGVDAAEVRMVDGVLLFDSTVMAAR